MFGVTQYSGDRRTVNAALDKRRNQEDWATLDAERQDYLADADARLQRAGALNMELYEDRVKAEASLKEAEARLKEARGRVSAVDAKAEGLRRDALALHAEAKGLREKAAREARGASACRDASAPARERHADAVRRTREAESRSAMWHAAVEEVLAALGEAAPGHPLLRPADVGYADGSERRAIDAVFDEAADDVLRAHGQPTYASTLAATAG